MTFADKQEELQPLLGQMQAAEAPYTPEGAPLAVMQSRKKAGALI